MKGKTSPSKSMPMKVAKMSPQKMPMQMMGAKTHQAQMGKMMKGMPKKM